MVNSMELQSIIAGVIATHCKIICDHVKARWEGQSAIVGKAEIHSDLPKILGTIVEATIEGRGQRAWICEFGSGSNMDKSNPYLQEYLSSSNVNPWRFHNTEVPIMGRSEGEYKDLDGETRYSTGKMAGLDLERDGKTAFKAWLPQHIIKEEFEREYPAIIVAIQAAVAGFAVSQLTMTTEVYL